jgi:very-short-patch-repair endonuclease
MLKDVAPKARRGAITMARRLRREMSLPEVLLWQLLRERPRGLKIRKQHPSGVYVLDFYCADARLAIEIDGAGHRAEGRAVRDQDRDTWFGSRDIETLRIMAVDVLRDPGAAADVIVATCRARSPLHHPAAPGGPPPRGKLGEDL